MASLIKKPFFCFLIIFGLVFTAYSFMLQGSFKTMDDEVSIIQNEQIQSFSNIPNLFTSSFFNANSYYRPLVSLTYMIEYHFFGLNPLFYYLTNIFLHVAISLSLFWLLILLLKDRLTAFAVALLFAVHPIHWEAVSNISGRAILLCALFYILTFIFYHRAQDRNSRTDFFLSLAFFVPALFSKESALMFPALAFTYRALFLQERGRRLLKGCLTLVPYVLLGGTCLMVRHILGISRLYLWPSLREAWLGFVTFLRSVITYLRILFIPVDLQFDRSARILTDFFNPEVFLTILSFGFLFGFVWTQRKRLSPAALFFLAWFFVELIPVSQFFASIGVQFGYISIAEHFLYTPSIGIFVLVGLSFRHLARLNRDRRAVSPKILKMIVGVLYAFLFFLTIGQNIYSSHEIPMLKRSLELNPENLRIRYNLAYSYVREGRYYEAEIQFRKVLERTPFIAKARIGLGKALVDQGRLWDGIREYEKIGDAGPLNELLENNRRAAYRLLSRRYKDILKDRPDDPQVHYSLGVVTFKLGQAQLAADHFQKAVILKPGLKNALFNLALAYEALDQPARAAGPYENLLGLDGEKDYMDRHALSRLAEIYAEIGPTDKALEYNKKFKDFEATHKQSQ